MVETYRALCSSCSASYTVKYGSITNALSYEIYSCPYCKNLFSLTNQEPFTCPTCKNRELIRYNFHKEENLVYYEKMFKQNLLSKENYDLLVSYWENTKNNTCPVCNNTTLEWHIISDTPITSEPQMHL